MSQGSWLSPGGGGSAEEVPVKVHHRVSPAFNAGDTDRDFQCYFGFVSLTAFLLYVTFELRSTITASEGEMTAPTIFCNECGASNPLQATLCFACNNALQPSAASLLLQVQAASTSAAVPTS